MNNIRFWYKIRKKCWFWISILAIIIMGLLITEKFINAMDNYNKTCDVIREIGSMDDELKNEIFLQRHDELKHRLEKYFIESEILNEINQNNKTKEKIISKLIEDILDENKKAIHNGRLKKYDNIISKLKELSYSNVNMPMLSIIFTIICTILISLFTILYMHALKEISDFREERVEIKSTLSEVKSKKNEAQLIINSFFQKTSAYSEYIIKNVPIIQALQLEWMRGDQLLELLQDITTMEFSRKQLPTIVRFLESKDETILTIVENDQEHPIYKTYIETLAILKSKLGYDTTDQ